MTLNKHIKLKIIIIRLSSMGDIVLTTKLIRNIKSNFPSSNLDFVASDEYLDCLNYNPYIDNILVYQKNNNSNHLEIRNYISKSNYDLIIDLQKSHRSKFITQNSNSKIVYFDKRRLFKYLLVYPKIKLKSQIKPIAELYCDTLISSYENVIIDNKGLEFWFENEKEYKETIINNPQKNKLRIAIAPAAHFKTKQWLPENFIELIELLNKKLRTEIYLLGGKQDYELCEMIAQRTGAINYAGKLSIIESAIKIDASDLLITNDTGLMHIGSARQIPTVVFYGSTTPDLGFIPYKNKNIIIQQEMWCRPCSHIGRNKCPLIHFNCMKKITPKLAFNKILKFINNLYIISSK